MIEPECLVGDDELLARFVLSEGHVRADGTIKPDPFIPYKHTELSVTRHIGLDMSQIWTSGQTVAAQVTRRLIGRADAIARLYRSLKLDVEAAPVVGNPNHANVTGWPKDKPAQKVLALLIAREASYIPVPNILG
jgi:hypothetical protein